MPINQQLIGFLLFWLFAFNSYASEVFIILKNLRNNPVSIYEKGKSSSFKSSAGLIGTIYSQNNDSQNLFDKVKIFKYSQGTLTLLPEDPDEIMAEFAGWRKLIPNVMENQNIIRSQNMYYFYQSGWKTQTGYFDQILVTEEQNITGENLVIIQEYDFDCIKNKKYTFVHKRTMNYDVNENSFEIAELIFSDLNLDPIGREKIENNLNITNF